MIEATEWAHAIGAEFDNEGVPTQASLVAQIRAAATTGYLLRSRIVRALKESYSPFRCKEDALHQAIHDACDALVAIGDLTVFQSDSGPGYVATPERLVAVDDREVVVLGMAPGSHAPIAGLVRRLPTTEAQANIAAPLISLANEIGVAAWRLHLLSAGGSDVATEGPAALFARLAGAAAGGEGDYAFDEPRGIA